MDGTKLTKDIFLDNVKDHKMTILKDDGLYRHLVFSKGSSDQWFEIITWPGYLAYVGDMGSFIFQRVEDMFTFFRNREGELRINPGYWAEKVEAESVYGEGIRQFSVEEFRTAVLTEVEYYVEGKDGEVSSEEIMKEIEELLCCGDEIECVSAVRDFHSDKCPHLFDDFWEHTLTRGTWHYIWCCYAIAWAVIQYDKYKEYL